MKNVFLALFIVFAIASVHAEEAPAADDSPFAKLDWHRGPAAENIAAKATLKTDANLSFLDEANSTKFLELTGNIPEQGNFILVPAESEWWATFTFDPMGYVKDDEKIDADELLASIKSSDEPANEERRRRGISEIVTEGWSVPPHYDNQTKQLEWGIKLRSEGHEVVNYTVRLLGRTGVMNATLVTGTDTLQDDVKSFKASLAGFQFNSGEGYAEYREGDRVAEYGLAALVVGGAAAIAAKTGFLAKFWKLILLGGAGLVAWIGKLFGRKNKT